MRIALPLAVLAALAGCSAGEGEGDAAPAAPQATTASPAPAAVPAPDVPVSLQADGLVIGRGGTLVAYGTPRAEVEAALLPALGAPTDTAAMGECGAGPMEFASFGPLMLNFLDGEFVGWFLDEGSPIATTDGVAPGAAFSQVASERGAEMVTGSTLDGEFSYAAPDGGFIGGFVEGAGEAARVKSLYAGTTCFFR